MSRKQSPGDARRQAKRQQRTAERKSRRDAERQQQRQPSAASKYRVKQHCTAMAQAFQVAVQLGRGRDR